jgi:hypothetical protein
MRHAGTGRGIGRGTGRGAAATPPESAVPHAGNTVNGTNDVVKGDSSTLINGASSDTVRRACVLARRCSL